MTMKMMMMADNFCFECKRCTEIVFDHSTGDTVCSECGLVLDSRSVDETSEWRTFADSDGPDPNRVGSPTDPLLPAPLTTLVSKPSSSSSVATRQSSGGDRGLGWAPMCHPEKGAHSHARLIAVFDAMGSMGDRLGLVPKIVNRGKEIYKRVYDEDQKSWRARNKDATLAACLLEAARLEGVPRSLKEVCSVANVRVTVKELNRAKSHIKRALEKAHEKGQLEGVELGRSIRAGDLVRRFCSNLGITSNQVIKAAQETVQKSEEIDVRRSPVSVAAAIIYIVSQLAVLGKPMKDVAVVTRVSEGTIKNVYKDLYPHLGNIIPTWFANEGDLKKLCTL